MAKGERLDWVDTGRGLAISLVALFHATNWIAATRLDVSMWADLSTVVSSLRMPFFFALAGLFAGKWLHATWGEVVRSKVLLFLWVLVVWTVIGMVVQLSGMRAAGEPVNLAAAARDTLLSPVIPRFELWFIWALAVFFLVAKATRRVPPLVQLAAAGIMSAIGLTVWLNTTTGLTGSAKFYFFFLCGLYLRALLLRIASARVWMLAAVVVVWAVVSTVLFVLDLRAVPGAYFVNCLLGVAAGVAISRALVRLPLLQRLGRQTLPIYLAHTPIIIALSIVLLLVPGLLDIVAPIGWLIPPLAAVAGVAGALWLHARLRGTPLRYLYEPIPAAVRVLGGRG